jgi:plastocyanin
MTSRIALLTLLSALLLPSSLAQAQGNPRLIASVNQAAVITLRDANGNAVTNVAPGTYDVAVSDTAEEHNFHLAGPGVDRATSILAREEVTWTVTLADGRYTFVCDAHPTTMRGAFTVGTAPPPPPPPTRARLTGSVGPGKRISVRPRTVAAGPVTLTVTDRSRVDNFHLTGPGVNRKTGVAFRGRVSWNLTLAAGRYTFRSDRTRRLRGTFTVTPPA